jgi:hypothetical protein
MAVIKEENNQNLLLSAIAFTLCRAGAYSARFDVLSPQKKREGKIWVYFRFRSVQ